MTFPSSTSYPILLGSSYLHEINDQRSVEKRERQRLQALWELNILDTSPEQPFDHIVNLAERIFDVPMAFINFIEADRQWSKAGPGGFDREIPRDDSFCTHTVSKDDLLVVEDATHNPQFANKPSVTGEPGIRFYAGVPLHVDDQHAVGSLCIADTEPRSLKDDEGEMLSDLAHLVEELLEMRRQGQHKHFLSSALETAREPVVITEASQLDSPGPKIIWVNSAFCQLTGYSAEELIGETPRILQGPETDRETLNRVRASLEAGEPVRAEAVNYKKDGTPYVVDWTITPVCNENGDITHWVSVQRNVTEHREREYELMREVREDPLTELLNRKGFVEKLDNLLREAPSEVLSRHAVLYLDLDRFKFVNDSFGHQAGDALLRTVGDRLRNITRDEDIIARFGGDEFALLVGECERREVIDNLAERIQDALDEPIQVENRTVFTSASVGILHDLTPYSDAEKPLQHADVAMYTAKRRGRRQAAHFDDEMYKRFREYIRLESEIRRALDNNAFIPYYQPIVDLQKDKLVGFEALARWEHPNGEILTPGTFLDVATETGLMIGIGEQVMEKAFEHVKEWERFGWKDLLLVLSVNFSRAQLMQPDALQRLLNHHKISELDPSRFMIEINEEALGRQPAEVTNRIRNLQEAGFKLGLDDFGTGYTSMNALRQLPVSYIKLDRSLVDPADSDPQSEVILESATRMAQKLGKRVIAEGVETPSQLALLREMECDYAQGYLLGRPVPADKATELLKGKQSWVPRSPSS